jgi:hypothetical protein
LDVLNWAKDVNYALKQLAGISGNQSRAKKNAMLFNSLFSRSSHPWQCTANGNGTIYVGEGRVHSYLDGDSALASVSMAGFGDWEGGNVTVTSATGVIYGTVPAALSAYPIVNYYASSAGESADVQITLFRTTPDPMGTIEVEFAEVMPIDTTGNTYYWEIAQVSLADSIASVSKQVLRHDPMLWSFLEGA